MDYYRKKMTKSPASLGYYRQKLKLRTLVFGDSVSCLTLVLYGI